jgi:hypothetical protein
MVFSFCALVSKTCQYRITSPVKVEVIYKTSFSNILKSDMTYDRPEQATDGALVLHISKDILLLHALQITASEIFVALLSLVNLLLYSH